MKKLLARIVGGAPAAVAVPARAATTPPPLKATVGDNFFKPTKKTIPKGTKVVWTWRGAVDHNVTLAQAPKGVKPSKFTSKTQTTGTFARTPSAPGKYTSLCTIPPEMIQ